MTGKIAFLILLLSASLVCYAQELPRENPPVSVTVSATDTVAGGFHIQWMAGENFGGYEIFFQMEGSRIIYFFSTPQIVYNRADETCAAGIKSTDLGRGKIARNDRKWRIGVRCRGRVDHNGRGSNPSEIVWSDYIAMTQ